jgi:hypothetical protein
MEAKMVRERERYEETKEEDRKNINNLKKVG